MDAATLEALALGGNPLKFQCPPRKTSSILKGLDEWQGYVSRASVGVGVSAGPDASTDIHHQVVRFMTSVRDVAGSSSNHPVVAKCREHFDYFTEKSREFGTDLSMWRKGVEFAKPSDDAQRVVSDVVRERI